MRLKRNICHNGWLPGTPCGVLAAILLFCGTFLLQGCFTGIESTPKITYKDVRKQNAGGSQEGEFSGRLRPVPFSEWSPGRRFLMADAKGALTYSAPAGKMVAAQVGDTIVFRGTREAVAITGGKVAELVFTLLSSPADTLLYRPGGDRDALMRRGNLRLPFLVDLELVGDAEALLAGKTLFTRTDRWLDADGSQRKGRKFLAVRVTGVEAGNEDYPFLVYFVSTENPDEKGALAMSTTEAEGVPALRGFDNLFLTTDPRDSYPQISDASWELIRQGKVAEGMTSQEVTLALGSPRDVDRRHDQSMMYERWSYPGGVYVIFENGLLVRYNQ